MWHWDSGLFVCNVLVHVWAESLTTNPYTPPAEIRSEQPEGRQASTEKTAQKNLHFLYAVYGAILFSPLPLAILEAVVSGFR